MSKHDARGPDGRFAKSANEAGDGSQVVGDFDKNPKPFQAIGAPGTVIYGGYVVDVEKDSRLSGQEKYETFDRMLANVGIVAAGVRYFLNVAAKSGWNVEPADDSTEAAKIAETVEDIMHDMTTPWHRVIRRAVMARFKGFSIQEWTAKRRDDGVIGYLDIESRPQKTIEKWDRDPSGTVQGVVQVSPQTGREIYLPRGKLLYVVDDTLTDNPEGLGLFRHLAKLCDELMYLERLESWGLQRDLRGTPIGRAPLVELMQMVNAGQLTNEQFEELKRPLKVWIDNVRRGRETSMLLDSAPYRATGEQNTPAGNTKQWDVELLSGDGGPHQEVAGAIERKTREIARVLGVEHLLLGSDSKGSYALSRDKTQSFGLLVDSALRETAFALRDDFLGPLFMLNGWDEKLRPCYKVDQTQYRDIEQITGALADLAGAGAPLGPNDPAINEVRSVIGLSDAPEEIEVDEDAAIPNPNKKPSAPGDKKPTDSGEVPEAEEEETEE